MRQHIGTKLCHRTFLKLLRHINDRLRILNFINADLIFDPCINKLHGYASVFLLVFNYIRKVSRKSKALFLFHIHLIRETAERKCYHVLIKNKKRGIHFGYLSSYH